MRINPNESIASQLVADTKLRSDKSSKASSSASSNRASSSQSAADFSADTTNVGGLTALAMQTPEIRQDRVSALRDAVRNGSYQLDPGKIADAMLQQS
jgi:negative regulator of flagellin synthesis FlgM